MTADRAFRVTGPEREMNQRQGDNMPEQRTPIVGSKYHPGAEARLALAPLGAEIELKRDPYGATTGNAHPDENAVACYLGSVLLGFVPRTHNQAIAAAIDTGTATAILVEPLGEAVRNVRTGNIRREDPRILVRWS